MWKFLDGLEGAAQLSSGGGRVDSLARGEWAYVVPYQVGQSGTGSWIVNSWATLYHDCDGSPIVLLHDMAGGWNLIVPRNFKPDIRETSGDMVKVTRVYRPIPLSRKMNLIYEAPPLERVGRAGLV